MSQGPLACGEQRPARSFVLTEFRVAGPLPQLPVRPSAPHDHFAPIKEADFRRWRAVAGLLCSNPGKRRYPPASLLVGEFERLPKGFGAAVISSSSRNGFASRMSVDLVPTPLIFWD